MREPTELRATRMLFVGSFLISTVLLVGLSLAQPLRSNIAAGYAWGAALVLGTLVIGTCTGKRRGLLRFFLLVSILNLVLVPPELYLRLRGFRYESGIQFGYPRPYQFNVFQPDEKLFWTFPRSRSGVNSYGFEGLEVTRPKPAGTYRVLFLGNSCTYQGTPAMIELILHGTHPEAECLNFATPGYTSYQGKVIAESYLAELQPDLLVVSYGWNDRWLAYGAPDEDKHIVVPHGAGPNLLAGLYARWRSLQFVRKALAPVLGKTEPLSVSRVPLGQFRTNLELIGTEAAKLGVPVIYATEPSSHPTAGVPSYVVDSKYAVSKDSSLELFREYNGTLREVAGERPDWHLIDLDAEMSPRADVRELFTADGIHYSKAGSAVVADIEARFILDHFLSTHGAQR
jgi:lysophospholipase L1-like esterase